MNVQTSIYFRTQPQQGRPTLDVAGWLALASQYSRLDTPPTASLIGQSSTRRCFSTVGKVRSEGQIPVLRRWFTPVPQQESEDRRSAIARVGSVDPAGGSIRRSAHRCRTTHETARALPLIFVFEKKTKYGGCQPNRTCSSTRTWQDRNSHRRSRGEVKRAGHEQPSTRSLRSNRGRVTGQRARGFPMGSRSVDRRPSSWNRIGTQKEQNSVRKISTHATNKHCGTI